MLSRSLKIAAVSALSLFAAGGAMAASVTVMQQYPTKQSQQKIDHALTDQLDRQGFQNVSLTQNGGQVSVTGMRQDEQLTLTYDKASGQLVEVNGQPAMTQQMLNDSMTGHGSAAEIKG